MLQLLIINDGKMVIEELCMAKYGPKAQEEIGKTIKKFEKGTLKSGSSNQPVKNRQQAIAIGISQAHKKGAKVPKQPHK